MAVEVDSLVDVVNTVEAKSIDQDYALNYTSLDTYICQFVYDIHPMKLHWYPDSLLLSDQER